MGTVSLKWLDSQLMVGADSRGTPLVMGSWAEKDPQWTGLKPSDLLLLAAASCSAWDVISILRKQREPMESLEVQCSGEQQQDPPWNFTHIHLHYVVRGSLDPKKVERAIALSEEKYCSVINTLRPGVQVTHDFEVLPPDHAG